MDPNKVNDRVFKMSFAGVYPHYVNKIEKKGRTKKELDQVADRLRREGTGRPDQAQDEL